MTMATQLSSHTIKNLIKSIMPSNEIEQKRLRTWINKNQDEIYSYLFTITAVEEYLRLNISILTNKEIANATSSIKLMKMELGYLASGATSTPNIKHKNLGTYILSVFSETTYPR